MEQPRKLLLVLVIGLLFVLSACDTGEEETAVAGRIEVTPIPRTVICHATGFDAVPYAEITVSQDTAERHRNHAWDIIPAPMEGCPEGVQQVSEDDVPTATAADNDNKGEATTPEPETRQARNATPTPRPRVTCEEDDTIAALLRGDDRLERIAGAFEQAGFMDVLAEHGPLTIFAPTDDAFEDLPGDVVDEWINDEGRLNALLLYHTADGNYPAEELRDLSSLEMISGDQVFIDVQDDEIVLNEDVRIIDHDLEACNGVVHVIDGVLLPDILEQDAEPTPTPLPTSTPDRGDDDRDDDDDSGGAQPPQQPPPTDRPEPTERPTSTPVPTDAPTDALDPTEAPTSAGTTEGNTGGDTGGSDG